MIKWPQQKNDTYKNLSKNNEDVKARISLCFATIKNGTNHYNFESVEKCVETNTPILEISGKMFYSYEQINKNK